MLCKICMYDEWWHVVGVCPLFFFSAVAVKHVTIFVEGPKGLLVVATAYYRFHICKLGV